MTEHRRSRSRRLARLLAVPLAAALVVASCGGDDDDSTGGDDAADDADDADAGDDADTGDDDTDGGGGDDGDSGDSGDSTDDGGAGIVDDDESDGSPVVETIAPEVNEDPVFGGTLRYGLEGDVAGLNPAASTLTVSGLMMSNAVFDTLSALTPDGQWVPYLAESFTPSEDFRTWTVTLREGITFHDGTPLDAAAVVANFESQRSHPLVGLAVKPFYPEEGATTIVDDLTVQYNLLDPDAKWPTAVSGQLGMVASPTWLAAAAEDGSLNQAPVGTGPFLFDSRSEDSVTRFVRNDGWWNGDVYLDAVEFFPVPDSDNRTDLLFGGEIDAMHTTNQVSILDIRDAGDEFERVEIDAAEESFAMMNSSVPPFDDIRAREALTRATPVDLYNDLIGLGVNRPAEQMFIPESPFYNPDVTQAHDDPERAIELATEYCAERGSDENPVLGGPTCTDGKINIELQWSGPSVVQTRIADLLDEAWSVAFNVTFNELLQDEHVSQAAFGQYNAVTWRQFGAANPTNDNVWLLCRTIGGISLNWPRYCDEDRDALILEVMATPDDADRAPILQELVEKINDDYLYIFFNHTMWQNAFAAEVNGVCDRTAPDGTLVQCANNGRTWFSSVWIG